MNDLTRETERVLSESKALVRDNREGGRHRRAPSLGQGSAKAKRKHLMRKLRNLLLAVFAIWVAGGIAGAILGGIGFWGVMAVVLATVIAIGIFSSFPKLKTPKRVDINKGTVQQMVGQTELWLEAQRPALPAPAVRIVDDMGVQLDALGLQLDGLDQNHPKAREVRSLVGEQLPQMIDSYRRIPANLRTEKRAGATPDEQLTDSLGKISGEIDSITRQLAEGSLDDLAIKHRYLDYKFGEGADTAPQLENKN
ncbi:hypothetical protein [Qipengyuania sp. 483]